MPEPRFLLDETKEELNDDLITLNIYARMRPGDSAVLQRARENLEAGLAFCDLLDVWFRIARMDGEVQRRLDKLNRRR